jgi:CheY-like chemotaxis protein
VRREAPIDSRRWHGGAFTRRSRILQVVGGHQKEVCRRLRQESADRPYVYVLLLTARTEREDLLQGLQSGADDYIRKPFDPPERDARLRTGPRILDLQDKLIAIGAPLRQRRPLRWRGIPDRRVSNGRVNGPRDSGAHSESHRFAGDRLERREYPAHGQLRRHGECGFSTYSTSASAPFG